MYHRHTPDDLAKQLRRLAVTLIAEGRLQPEQAETILLAAADTLERLDDLVNQWEN